MFLYDFVRPQINAASICLLTDSLHQKYAQTSSDTSRIILRTHVVRDFLGPHARVRVGKPRARERGSRANFN